MKLRHQRTIRKGWRGQELRSEKQLHGQFKRETDDLSSVSWNWIRTGELKETEELIFAAQEQTPWKPESKTKIYHPNAECVEVTMKLCSIFCVVTPSLRRQNIKRHDVVGRVIHWELCKECSFECCDKWYEHSPKSVEENEEVKLLWDFTIQSDREIHHRRPDIVIQKKKVEETIIVDIAVPGDSNITQKESGKVWKVSRPGKRD